MRYVASLIVLAAVASVAPAAISMSIVETDNSAVLGSGYVTNDLLVTTDTDWMQSQILLTTNAGSVYQTPGAGQWYPQPGVYQYVPALEFDTWMCTLTGGVPSSEVEAGDLGGDAFSWSTSHLDAAWYNTASTDIGTDLLNARITLSDDANGTWKYIAWGNKADPNDVNYPEYKYLEGTIVDGYMVPEPVTIGMLMLGGLGVLARRRRS